MSSEAARAIEAILMVAQEPVEPHLLAQLLGHQRKVRRFARKFDEYRQQAPFLMDQTHTGHGKVYRKISDK